MECVREGERCRWLMPDLQGPICARPEGANVSLPGRPTIVPIPRNRREVRFCGPVSHPLMQERVLIAIPEGVCRSPRPEWVMIINNHRKNIWHSAFTFMWLLPVAWCFGAGSSSLLLFSFGARARPRRPAPFVRRHKHSAGETQNPNRSRFRRCDTEIMESDRFQLLRSSRSTGMAGDVVRAWQTIP